MVNSGRVKHASLYRGVWGIPPEKNQKVSALRLILVRFGNQTLNTVVIAPVPAYCLSTAVLLHV